jgi:hypothetical protein
MFEKIHKIHPVQTQEKSRYHKGIENTTSFEKMNNCKNKWIQHVRTVDNHYYEILTSRKEEPRTLIEETTGLLY